MTIERLIEHTADERVAICRRMRQAALPYDAHRECLLLLAGEADPAKVPPRELQN
jgi:hypothetical protein